MHLSMMQMVAFIGTDYKLNHFPLLCYVQTLLLKFTPQHVYISKHSVKHQGSWLRLTLYASIQSVTAACFYESVLLLQYFPV